MLRRMVEVSKLQWLGKISSAKISLGKAMKELQENSSKLPQLFRNDLVVAFPLLMYQFQFITHFAGKPTPRLFVRLYYFPCSLAKTPK